MSKYKILKDNLKNVVGEEFERTLPIIAEEYEAKIRRQAAEITRLLAENKELKKDLEYYHTGTDTCDIESARAAGQQEAWEFTRNIALSETYGGYSNNELKEIFGSIYLEKIFNLTYTEAAAKVESWEKSKEEIKVGDVYKSLSGNFVVCGIDREKDMVKALWDDLSVGKIYLYEIKEQYTKTGRHIDIDSFLKQIGGEKNEDNL